MFKVFKSGFRISDSNQLNSFSSEIIKLTEEYVKFLIRRGMIYQRDNTSTYETAVSLTLDLFKIENGYLVNFKRFFESTGKSIKTEDEIMKEIGVLLYPLILDKLSPEYKHTAMLKSKLFEGFKQMEEGGRFLVTKIFTEKYIHRKPVDFSSAKCMEKETLVYLLRTKNGTKHQTIESFTEYVFDILESQNLYLHAIPYCQAVQIYREFFE